MNRFAGFVFLFLILLSGFFLKSTFAEGPIIDEVSVSTDQITYSVGDPITISGEVTNIKMPEVAIKIFDPEDQILGAYSVEIDQDGYFEKTIFADSPFYEKNGLYTVEVNYGKLSEMTVFEIDNSNGGSANPAESPPTIIFPEVRLVESDKTKYFDEETVFINGAVSANSLPQVTIAIFDPNGSPSGIYLAPVNPDLTFSTSFIIKENVNFKVEGIYSITAQYGGSETRKSFQIEFTGKQTSETSVNDPSSSSNNSSSNNSSSNNSSSNNSSSNNSSSNNSYSFLLSETDLETLATWYYLNGSDEQLASLLKNFLNSGLINPNTNEKITTKAILNWIDNSRTTLGIAIDNLFSEKISEEKFFTTIEHSIENYLGKSKESSIITTNPIPSQPTKDKNDKKNQLINTEEPNASEISKESNSDEPLPEIVYINTSENCKIHLYEDFIPFYNNPGPALSRLCKFDDAIVNYDQTLRSDPNNVVALTDKGSALSSLGRYQAAIDNYDKVLKIDPYNINALNNKGNALSSLERYQEAIDVYDKALSKDPLNQIILNNKEKSSSFLTVYHPTDEEPKITMVSHTTKQELTEKPIQLPLQNDDFVSQFAKVFSSIGASIVSLLS